MDTITIKLDSSTAEYIINLLTAKAENMESLYKYVCEKHADTQKRLDEALAKLETREAKE